ncbi:MAG: copper resistance system multicopper oxidase [Pseudomonadota bacterium]
MRKCTISPAKLSLSRRRFVKGLAAGGALIGFGQSALAMTALGTGQKTLSGSKFDLTYSPLKVNFTGQERFATAINGSVPAPTLRFKEGDDITLNVTNHLAEDTSIHWHGLILPSSQDGVPHISEGFTGIRPGEQFRYQFPVVQNGTYWYHSHSGFQEQMGAYGAIVIEPAAGYPFVFDREYTLVLSDWSDESPESVYATLKKMPHYYNQRERTFGDTWQQLQADGVAGFFADRDMWNQMRMSDRDISDVTGAIYTFLLNGVPPAEGWLGLFQRGETVLLRIINAAAMTLFDLRIPGLQMTVVAADGQYVESVSVDEIRLGVAETYDVLVTPSVEQAYTIFAQAIDRSGYARGTLTPDPALSAEVPPLDPAPVLGHRDMGMAMDHAGHGGHHAGHHHHGHHAQHRRQSVATKAQPDGSYARHALPIGSGPAGFGSRARVVHAPTEYGPQVDMRADAAVYQLDDPGVGLRHNGRRVLTYADLFNLHPTPDPREPGREINLHLTGNMSRYMWSINGVSFADAEPLLLKLGERVRINLLNDTMMNHPIHLHGMWSDLETGDPGHIPRKHTVIVQPGAKISYLVTADAPGGWAYHCHLLYHMLGMFRHVIVH